MDAFFKITGFHLSDDSGLVKLYLSAKSEYFCGDVDVYGVIGDLESLADEISGLPTPEDYSVKFSFSGFGGPKCVLEFLPLDSVGTIGVFVELKPESNFRQTDRTESCNFAFATNSNYIDTFCRQLRNAEPGQENEIVLKGRGS